MFRIPLGQSSSISTHAPARGATSRNGRPGKYLLFQPTLPRGERRFCLSTLKNIVLFQPTLPRGERHLPILLKRHKNQISTHAPARGATTQIWITTRGLQISTHAPARGATTIRCDFSGTQQFQPTLPRGERRVANFNSATILNISTHAPARGATTILNRQGSVIINFNPRSREGSDCNQHRHGLVETYFNPRSREGSDCKMSG